MTENMPNDPDELDWMIGFDMVDKAMAAVTDAEEYAKARSLDPPPPDWRTFPKWSEVSEPGELDFGPYTPRPEEE